MITNNWRILAVGISVLISSYGLSATPVLVPRFAYVANNQDDTVSIFAIEKARLRAVGYIYTGPGSNPRAVVVTPSQNFLYVAEGDTGIAGYAVNNLNGTLSLISGSPYLTGSELGLAMHPSGKFLITLKGNGISSYAIDPHTGALSLIQSLSGQSAVPGAIDPTGSFLFTANVNSNTVSGYSINQSTGFLTRVTGSPFPAGANPQSVVIPRSGKFLYVPNGNGANVSAYSVNHLTGALAPVPGSPFATGAAPLCAVAKNSFLFVGNAADNTVSQYAINQTDGSLTQVAPPLPTGASGPMGLTASPTDPLFMSPIMTQTKSWS